MTEQWNRTDPEPHWGRALIGGKAREDLEVFKLHSNRLRFGVHQTGGSCPIDWSITAARKSLLLVALAVVTTFHSNPEPANLTGTLPYGGSLAVSSGN